MTISAKVVADSISEADIRLTTLQLRYPKFIHGEFMTHRVFCLAGDAELEFDMPAGQHGGNRRTNKMTIADFVSKWRYGSAPHSSRWGTQRVYDMRPRLEKMRIRQVDEATGEITTSFVVGTSESGMKPVYEITAGNYKIAGSKDHRILTDDGWKTVKEIQIGDQLVVRTRKKPNDLRNDPLRLKKIGDRWISRWNIQQRQRLIDEDPLCRNCRNYPGSEIHHIVPVHVDANKAFDECNATLLCYACHKEQHQQQGWQEGVPFYSGTEVVDQIRFRGVEPTYDLEIAGPFPNFLANGVVVHNSRNASSSRAIPVERLIKDVIDDPVYPSYWGKNQPGMQAAEECAALLEVGSRSDGIPVWCSRDTAWDMARGHALDMARAFTKAGYHKQIINRLLEPFCHINVVVTATEWSNFFALRCHPDAQPEMRELAEAMRDATASSIPRLLTYGQWHLPYVERGFGQEWNEAIKLSVARCARVSYLTQEGKTPTVEEDLKLYDRLVGAVPLHASPCEHQAMPDVLDHNEQWSELGLHGNFVGWIQYRKTLLGECQ